MPNARASTVDTPPAQNRHRGRVTIREAQLVDIPRLVEMGAAFLAESPYGRLFPTTGPERIEAVVAYVLNSGVVFVAELDEPVHLVGMIGLLPYEHPLSGHSCVEEVAWFVEPAARASRIGVELLDAAETWAARKNAALLKLAAPALSDVGRYLERMDYTAVETAYVKALR